MIRNAVSVVALLAALAGCSPRHSPRPASEEPSGSPFNISGTAVTGVVGGSGQSTRMVSGIKDLELSVGVDLGGN